MRNVLAILTSFVCASICLGGTGQTITISGDIGEQTVEYKKGLEQLETEWKKEREALEKLKELRLDEALKKKEQLDRENMERHMTVREQQHREQENLERQQWVKREELEVEWKKELEDMERQQGVEREELEAEWKKRFDMLPQKTAEHERWEKEDQVERTRQAEEQEQLELKLEQEEEGMFTEQRALELIKTNGLKGCHLGLFMTFMCDEREQQRRHQREELREKHLGEDIVRRTRREMMKGPTPMMTAQYLLDCAREKLEHEHKQSREQLWKPKYLVAVEEAKRVAELKEQHEQQLEREELEAAERVAELKEQHEQQLEREELEAAALKEQYERERRAMEAAERVYYPDIAGNGDPDKKSANYGKVPSNGYWNDPNNNRLIIINPDAKVGNAYGAKMNKVSVGKNVAFRSMTNNEVIVNAGDFHNKDIAGAFADDTIYAMKVSSNTVRITGGSKIGNVYGGRVYKGTVSSSTVTISSSVTIGQDVYGGYIVENGTATGNKVNLTDVNVKQDVYGAGIDNDGLASSNTVTINGGKIEGIVYGGRVYKGTVSSNTVTISSSVTIGQDVYGGYIVENGTATGNKVNLTDVDVTRDVYGAWIGKDGLASSNTVTISSGAVQNVFGGYIVKDGTATLNTVDMTDVKVTNDVYGAWIGNGLASSNTVTINDETVGLNVYGGYIVKDGTATGNTVTINGGTVRGNIFGGYVGGDGKAINNTINITGTELSFPEFSTATILCGGICRNVRTNDAFTGNTLNIKTKRAVEVKGISNFENYNFYLSGVELREVVLTATHGGCSWNTDKEEYTTDCAVDLSRSNIILHTQGVINKGDYYTLIKSSQGFKDNGRCAQFEFKNIGLVEYYWGVGLTDDGQGLIATLTDKKIRDKGVARSLSEGYGAGIACTNSGMDCILSKMEETESLLGERKGEIGAFCGLAANKSQAITKSCI